MFFDGTFGPCRERHCLSALVKVFRINPEFRILRLNFHRMSASKCRIKEIIIASLISFQIN